MDGVKREKNKGNMKQKRRLMMRGGEGERKRNYAEKINAPLTRRKTKRKLNIKNIFKNNTYDPKPER